MTSIWQGFKICIYSWNSESLRAAFPSPVRRVQIPFLLHEHHSSLPAGIRNRRLRNRRGNPLQTNGWIPPCGIPEASESWIVGHIRHICEQSKEEPGSLGRWVRKFAIPTGDEKRFSWWCANAFFAPVPSGSADRRFLTGTIWRMLVIIKADLNVRAAIKRNYFGLETSQEFYKSHAKSRDSLGPSKIYSFSPYGLWNPYCLWVWTRGTLAKDSISAWVVLVLNVLFLCGNLSFPGRAMGYPYLQMHYVVIPTVKGTGRKFSLKKYKLLRKATSFFWLWKLNNCTFFEDEFLLLIDESWELRGCDPSWKKSLKLQMLVTTYDTETDSKHILLRLLRKLFRIWIVLCAFWREPMATNNDEICIQSWKLLHFGQNAQLLINPCNTYT